MKLKARVAELEKRASMLEAGFQRFPGVEKEVDSLRKLIGETETYPWEIFPYRGRPWQPPLSEQIGMLFDHLKLEFFKQQEEWQLRPKKKGKDPMKPVVYKAKKLKAGFKVGK